MSRGREVMRDKLWVLHKGKTSKRVLAEVVAYCGTHDCHCSGQIEIFEEFSKNYQKTKRIISLLDIRHDPGVQLLSPCTSLSCSPTQQSPRGNSFCGTSPSSTETALLWPFQIIVNRGEVIEFFLETRENQEQWTKRLDLLLMFPYSPIPEEPCHTAVNDSFKAKLNPKEYGADSVWGVYILPEEVGSRVPVHGINILALQSQVSEKQLGRLDIISPGDPKPIISWDRDKIRRTGYLGNLAFIEIGRRCIGGPGLVWLYAGPKEASALRQTLHSFLFDGNGHAVATSASSVHSNGTPQASFNQSLSSCYSQRTLGQQSPAKNLHMHQLSIESQTMLDPALLGHSSSMGVPPPIDFSAHSNQRRSLDTSDSITYRKTLYENTTTELDSGKGSQQSSMHSESDVSQFQIEPDQGSVDFTDEGIGDMEPLFQLEDNQTTFQRMNSVPDGKDSVHRLTQSSLTTSSCQPSMRTTEYMRMTNPRSQTVKADYVLMQPAALSRHIIHETDPRSHFSGSEGVVLQTENQTIYENHALPSDTELIDYSPNYENMHILQQQKKYLPRYGLDRQNASSLKNDRQQLSENSSSTARSISPPSATQFVETGVYDIPRQQSQLDSSPSPVTI